LFSINPLLFSENRSVFRLILDENPIFLERIHLTQGFPKKYLIKFSKYIIVNLQKLFIMTKT
jgi:hypothetical protein